MTRARGKGAPLVDRNQAQILALEYPFDAEFLRVVNPLRDVAIRSKMASRSAWRSLPIVNEVVSMSEVVSMAPVLSPPLPIVSPNVPASS
eukprot:CAMPEP_0182558576 /NCGR_PEP_ID=MMETSP1324-20130603/2037_1 /TAXON_ID=236786 /ORGANISM="Florenciella sp., Strain RCC1587" /LENGTH=89 /DNA_ID=CAMNT_0024770753 /DNA_START=22 /DNA_END=289 /DNA_ORIENTATION=-